MTMGRWKAMSDKGWRRYAIVKGVELLIKGVAGMAVFMAIVILYLLAVPC